MNNNNSFSNASNINESNENLSNFIGYNNYYEGLRKAKGRGQLQNVNVAPLKEFWTNDDFYVEHIKPELEMMDNNIPTRKGANIIPSKPHTKRDMFQRALASTNKGEYKRLTNAYRELENPPPFVEFFLSERLKKKGGSKRKHTRRHTRRRTNKKRRTSRR
jgi:hypothetical protein